MDDLPSCASELRKQKKTQGLSLAMNTPSPIPAKTAKPKSYAAALRAPRPPPGPTPLTWVALDRLDVKNFQEEVRETNSWTSEEPKRRIKEWVSRIRALQNEKELVHPENPPQLK